MYATSILQTPLDASEDYETLLEYLLKDFDQDLKKLISIFCWIVQQKIPLLLCKKDIPPPDTPVGYLHAIRMKRGTYANLFAELCRYVVELAVNSFISYRQKSL